MNILGLIKDIFKPAVELVDELHTSEEEKLVQKANTLNTYVDAIEAGLAFEQESLKARARIVEAEAKSEHWLTSTWRPIVALGLFGMVLADSFGLLANPLAPEAWLLLQLCLGGYVVGRSAEKAGSGIIRALKKKEDT
jgi:hypothetical protein